MKPCLVLRPDGDPVAVGGELVEEGHGGPLPAAVDQLATAAPAASAARIIARIGVMPMPPAMNR